MPDEALAKLRPHLRRVALKRRQILQESNRPLEHVYFLESGLATQTARTKRDGVMQVGFIGRFGLVGLEAVLGNAIASHRCVMQIPGYAQQIEAEPFQTLLQDCPVVRQAMLSFVHAMMVQNTQSVLCNARHTIKERLARFLLFMRDRLEDDAIPLTQELLSSTLGVRRAGISTVLGELEEVGAVRRARGAVEIVSTDALHQAACECYGIINELNRRVTE
jgi:CRP-like cAMP-binding protein